MESGAAQKLLRSVERHHRSNHSEAQRDGFRAGRACGRSVLGLHRQQDRRRPDREQLAGSARLCPKLDEPDHQRVRPDRPHRPALRSRRNNPSGLIQAAMPGASLAAIVASLHGRSGKTLLARALVDYFILCGGKPYIFDTDAVERGLQALFPAAARVVDLTHHSLTKFFQLLRNTDFIFEARSHDITPVIFYIPDGKADSFAAGVVLRDNFADCRFIVVENTFLKEPKRNVCQDPADKALRVHKRRFVMPKLADSVVAALEDRNLSISDFMQQPISSGGDAPAPDGLSPDI